MATESTTPSSTAGIEEFLGVKQQKDAALALLASGLERMKLQNESLRLQNAQQSSVVSALQTQQEQDQFRNQMERAATVDPEMVPYAAAQYTEQVGPPAPPRFQDPAFVNQSRAQQLTEEQLSDPAFRDALMKQKEANLLSATLGIPVDLLSGILGIFGADIGTSTELLGSDPSPTTKLRRLALLNEVSTAGRQQGVELTRDEIRSQTEIATAGINATGRGSAVQSTADERVRPLLVQAHLNRQLEAAGKKLPSSVMSALSSGDPAVIREGIKKAEDEGFTPSQIADLATEAKDTIGKSVDPETRNVSEAELLAADASIANMNQIINEALEQETVNDASAQAEIVKSEAKLEAEVPVLLELGKSGAAPLQSNRFRGLVIRGLVTPRRFDKMNATQLLEALPEVKSRYAEAERNGFKDNSDLEAALNLSVLVGEIQKRRKAKGG